MSLLMWSDFATEIRRALRGFTVHVDGAESIGQWVTADGVTVHEQSRTWVAEFDPAMLDALRRRLAVIAAYGQDAIALTVGHTELVSA